MKSVITLDIYAKSTKSNTIGQLPIYIRLTIDGKRLEFSTKRFVDPMKWSSELFKMKGNSESDGLINNYLEFIKSKIFDIQLELVHTNQRLSI